MQQLNKHKCRKEKSREHIIDRIKATAEPDTESFISEWFSGQYDRIAECPHYEAVLAFCKAQNVLGRYWDYEYEAVTPSSIIKEKNAYGQKGVL